MVAAALKDREALPARKLADIERELQWRSWFPKIGSELDWSDNLSEHDTDVMFAACVAFMEDNLKIKVPGRGQIPLVLRPAQREVLRNWIQFRKTVSLKARQVGFSTLSAAFVLWQTFGWPDRLTVMLSKGERESVKLLAKVKYNYKLMPNWVKARGPKVLDRTRQIMTFDNDSVIESLPSANDPARGESVFLIVVDEWAFLPNPEEAWASIEPVTDIGGRVIGISTAKGEGNFFHNLWLNSQTGENEFVGIFHPWSAVTTRDDDWYARKKKALLPWQIAQEYPTTPEEAFVGSGNPVFDLVNLARFHPETPIGDFTITREGRKGFTIQEGGPLLLWDTPNDEDKFSYVIGVDIAMGELHGDYTVAVVLCIQTNTVVAVWHGNETDPDTFGEQILPALGWYFRNAVIAPEVNNHGLTTLTALKRAGYQRIYKRRSFAKRQNRALETLGWLTTQTSKPLAIDELATWMNEVPNIPHQRSIAELRSYRRNENGKMEGSPHDDCVMALAIAVQCRKYAIVERVSGEVDPKSVKGSFAWWENQLDGPKSGQRRLMPTLR